MIVRIYECTQVKYNTWIAILRAWESGYTSWLIPYIIDLYIRGYGHLQTFPPFLHLFWHIIQHCFSRNYYSAGSGSLQFDGRSLGVKPMEVVFDSGSTYTYFTAQPYQAVVSAVYFSHDVFQFPWIFEETNSKLMVLWPCSSRVVSANHLNKCQILSCLCAGKGKRHWNLCLTSRRNSSHCLWALPMARMLSWRSLLKTTSLSL